MKELVKISKKKPQEYSKPEVTKAENKEANGRPKGLLHWKQVSKKPVHKNTTVEQGNNQNVVNRPGHIRFENLDEDLDLVGKRLYNMNDATTRHTVQVYLNSWSAILVSLDNKGMWNLVLPSTLRVRVLVSSETLVVV
ncbi:hypothetical protein L1887_01605 [Cichorium endivia]|nr:hypothetical protein L1887_01605 [Cichorium endivia]